MKFNKKNIMILIDIVIALLIMLVLIGNSKQNNIISAMKNKTATIASLETDLKFDLKASPEEKRVKAGETVEIMLSVEDINAGEVGLNSIVGILDYDESVFDSFVVQYVSE